MKPWFQILNKDGERAQINLYGDIGAGWLGDSGIRAEDFAKDLEAIPRDKPIDLRIHSRGGDVFDALMIYNLLAARRENITAHIDGVALSAASFVAMSAGHIVMPKAARMMIHEAQGLAVGNSDRMREIAKLLDAETDNIASIYAGRTGQPMKKVREWMQATTWMNGYEAAQRGFADEVTDAAVQNCGFDLSIFRHVPEELAPRGDEQPKDSMNKKLRAKIITLLNAAELGVQNDVADDALLEQFTNYAESIQDSAKATQELRDAITAIKTELAKRNAAPPPAPPAPTEDPQIIDLRNRLETERRARVTAQAEPLLIERPYLVRDAWIDRIMANEGVLAELRAFPPNRPGADPVNAGNSSNGGNPLLEEYRRMQPGAARQEFRISNYSQLQRIGREFLPRNANTFAADLVPDFLADAVVTIAFNRLAMLNAFTTDFGTDPIKPKATVQVPKATVGATGQQNATNFESGDNTLTAIAVTVNQESVSFHISNTQANQGFNLRQTAAINAEVLADQISDRVTALLIAANYATPLVVGAGTAFDSADLPAIWVAAKNFKRRNLILDGSHLGYLLPVTKENFALGEAGAYNFDLIAMNNRWTGAVANTCGFVCGPEAIAVATGLPIELPAGEFLSVNTVSNKQGLTVRTCVWYSRASRSYWASYDLMFGAAVGDASQAEILVTA